jgi:hypothetical protein
MKGVQFVMDETGRKTAVLIDLAEWGELWENICDPERKTPETGCVTLFTEERLCPILLRS